MSTSRPTLALVATTALLLASAPAASATTGSDTVIDGDTDEDTVIIDVGEEGGEDRGDNGNGNGNGNGGGGYTGPTVTYRVVGNDADGPCRAFRTVPVAEGNPMLVGGWETDWYYEQLIDLGYSYLEADALRLCEGEAPALDLSAVYAAAERVVSRLPAATPDLATAHQITGLQTYLTTGRALEVVERHAVDVVTRTANITVTATGTYDVEWGDGETTTGVDVPGEGYPHGTVTHTYLDTGQLTLDVVDHWHVVVTTDVPGFERLDLGTTTLGPYTIDVPVEEVRAVRDR